MSIHRNLRFGNEDAQGVSKIRDLIDLFDDTFKRAYNPNMNISIDETLLLWKGNHSLVRYIPNKADLGIQILQIM